MTGFVHDRQPPDAMARHEGGGSFHPLVIGHRHQRLRHHLPGQRRLGVGAGGHAPHDQIAVREDADRFPVHDHEDIADIPRHHGLGRLLDRGL